MRKKIIISIKIPEIYGKNVLTTRKAILLKEYVKFWLVGVLDKNDKNIAFKTCVYKNEIEQNIKEEKTRKLKELLR